jgi:YjbR
MTEDEAVAIVRSVCLGLAEVDEEPAWVGTRWRVGGRTFAHVLAIEDGWPPAYARAAVTDGPCSVLTFRSDGPELDALPHVGRPFFAPPWRADEVGMILDDRVDRQEAAELVTESYRIVAPKRLTVD